MRRALVRSAAFAALLTGLVAVSGCATTPGPTPTPTATPTPTGDGVLRIGTLFPTSGTFAFLGPALTAGVNAAIREINAAGGVNGVPVEVVNRDSGDAASEKAEQSFAELVEKGVDVVIGPSSSVIAERLLDAAADAGIPLISPAATYPRLTEIDQSDVFFRTIPAYGHQGVVLAEVLADREVESVTLIYRDDELGRSLFAAAGAAFPAAGIELTAVKVTEGSDVAAVVEAIDEPDAVVLATPDNGDQTKAFIGRLTAAELGGERLWLTSQNLADYSQALPAGLLRDVNGVLEGAEVDDAFRALVKKEDPAVTDLRYAAEAYDATVLAALAAIQAGDDGGPAVATMLRDASVGGIKCTSFGECLDVLLTQTDIDYDGVSGSTNLDENGDPVRATYGVYRYTAENKYQRTDSVTG